MQFLPTMDHDNLLPHALVNMLSEGGYAVQHQHTFAPDLGDEQSHYFMAAFPQLFPYGVGGPWGDQKQKLSFLEHIQWYFQYHDQHFQTDHSFPFMAFG